MLGYLPGLLHAWYIIAKFPDPYDEYSSLPQGVEEGRVTYVIIQGPNGHRQRVPKNSAAAAGGSRAQGYGTTAPMAPPVHQGQDGTWANGQQSGVVNNGSSQGQAGEGSSGGAVPPTYAEAVKGGDHKIQSNH